MAPSPRRTWNLMRNPGRGLLFIAGPSPASPPGWHGLQCVMNIFRPFETSFDGGSKAPLMGSPLRAEPHPETMIKRPSTIKKKRPFFSCVASFRPSARRPLFRYAPQDAGLLLGLRPFLVMEEYPEINDIEGCALRVEPDRYRPL